MTRPVHPLALPAALLAVGLSLSACDGSGSAEPDPGATTSATPSASIDAATAALATRAGRYTYDSRGSSLAGGVPRDAAGTATLTVDPPVGDTQRTVLEGDQGRTETDVRLTPAGRLLTGLLVATPAFRTQLRPPPDALLLPEPPSVGRSWTWTATSADGRTRVTATNRIVRTSSLTIGGTRVNTRVVETRLALRGDVVYDGTTTTSIAPDQRLPVVEQVTGSGTTGGVPFSTDTTSTVRSLDPS